MRTHNVQSNWLRLLKIKFMICAQKPREKHTKTNFELFRPDFGDPGQRLLEISFSLVKFQYRIFVLITLLQVTKAQGNRLA